MNSPFSTVTCWIFGKDISLHRYDKKCKNIQNNRGKWEGGPGMTTWFYMGVGKMTMFVHDGGEGGIPTERYM